MAGLLRGYTLLCSVLQPCLYLQLMNVTGEREEQRLEGNGAEMESCHLR